MASSSWLCDWQDEHGLCWEMETQILCGQQERGIRSGGPAEEWKEKVEQMPSFKFTRSLLGDLCSHGDKVNMARKCHEVLRNNSESAVN